MACHANAGDAATMGRSSGMPAEMRRVSLTSNPARRNGWRLARSDGSSPRLAARLGEAVLEDCTPPAPRPHVLDEQELAVALQDAPHFPARLLGVLDRAEQQRGDQRVHRVIGQGSCSAFPPRNSTGSLTFAAPPFGLAAHMGSGSTA